MDGWMDGISEISSVSALPYTAYTQAGWQNAESRLLCLWGGGGLVSGRTQLAQYRSERACGSASATTGASVCVRVFAYVYALIICMCVCVCVCFCVRDIRAEHDTIPTTCVRSDPLHRFMSSVEF